MPRSYRSLVCVITLVSQACDDQSPASVHALEAEQAPGAARPESPGRFVVAAHPSGKPETTVRGVLCTNVVDGKPVDPTDSFRDDAAKIHVLIESDVAMGGSAAVLTVAVAGTANGTAITRQRLALAPDKPFDLAVDAPRGGFSPGSYVLELELPGRKAQRVAFSVVAISPQADLVDDMDEPPGINVALAALGGRVAVEGAGPPGAPGALIDGVATTWPSGPLPRDVVFTLGGAKPVTIAAVAIDPINGMARMNPSDIRTIPRHVEVWVSGSTAGDDFVRAGAGRIAATWSAQLIRFPRIAARRVRLRLISSYGSPVDLAEVKIYAPDRAAVVAQHPPLDLALGALGGRVSWFTSGNPGELVDGIVDPKNGWEATRSSLGDSTYLPQEFVFAFDRGAKALVDRVVVHVRSVEQRRPRLVAIELSDDSPLDGFREVARETLPKTPGAHDIAIGKEARFLKLRVLENNSPQRTEIGEVEIIEGRTPGYLPVLARPVGDRPGAASAPTSAAAAPNEQEPNDDRGHARPIAMGETVRGTLAVGDVDMLRLHLVADTTLTLDVSGTPDIRTSLSLLDDKKPVARYDAGRISPQREQLSWKATAGDRWIQIDRAPSSVVLVWDTSGSMGDQTKDLEVAVNAYVDTVKPGDRVQMIRFARSAELLTTEFTSDRDKLRAAMKGRFWADGATALYDALAKATDLLEGQPGHRTIVVMTDGSDSGIGTSSADLWQRLQRARVTIHAIGLGHDLTGYSTGIASSGDHVLAQLAHATGGSFLFTHNSSELSAFYRQIAAELSAPVAWSLAVSASTGDGALAVAATGDRLAASGPDVLLMLDASGSMKRPIAGKSMIAHAKQALTELIDGLPDDARVALRVYGHRTAEGRPKACTDSELVVPLGTLDKKRLRDKVAAVNALGSTPIAYSLSQAAGDLRGGIGERIVVLLTDGREECHGDPQKELAKLQASGLKVRLEVIGFALSDVAAKREMTKLASSAGGRYRDARDATSLAKGLRDALLVHWHAYDANGTEVARGEVGQSPLALPDGHYRVTVDATGTPIVAPDVRVRAGATTRVELNKEGNTIGVRVK